MAVTQTKTQSANSKLAGAFGKIANPEIESVSQDTNPSNIDLLAAALGSTSESTTTGTWDSGRPNNLTDAQINNGAKNDSLETKAQAEKEQEKAEDLQAHLAPLEKSNNRLIELFNSRKEEDRKNEAIVRADLNKLVRNNPKVTIGRNEIYTALNGPLQKSDRSIKDGGGKGWQNGLSKLKVGIQRLIKRIISAMNIDWYGAAKKKAGQIKGPGKEMSEAKGRVAQTTEVQRIMSSIEDGSGGE